MGASSGWTRAGSPDTITVALRPLSCQGAGHAIVATTRPVVRLAVPDQRRPRPPLGPTPGAVVRRRPVRQGATHGDLLVPPRRHRPRLPPRLRRLGGRRPSGRGAQLPAALRRPQTADAPGGRRPVTLRAGR